MKKIECEGVGDNDGFFELEVKASPKERLVMCGRCGSTPDEIDYSSVTDIYGVANQDADIMCSNHKCPNAVHVTFESDISGDNINRALKAAWNALNT